MLRLYSFAMVLGCIILSAQSWALTEGVSCPNGICKGLGESFYLPGSNVLEVNTNERQIFKQIPVIGGCSSKLDDYHQANDKFDYTEGMQNLVMKIATDSNIQGDIKTARFSMKATASAQTGFSSELTETYYQTIYDRSMLTGVIDLTNNAECYSASKLTDDVLSAFKALPLDLVDGPGKWAEKNERWNPYKVFLENYGSHILVQTQYGSRFQIWVSTQSTSSNIQSVLKAKACLDIEGSGPAGSGAVKGCSSVTEEQRKEAKSLSANIKKVIRGGTFATRAALTNETSSKNMEDFINSSENSDQAVNWRYKPIWGLLQSTYQTECQNSVAGSDACKNYQRALNLEAAYAGYLAWDCTYSNARTSLGLGGMTSTSADSKSVYTWSCSQSRVGCHNNDDCHVGGAGSVSYCYGSSCFDGEEVAGAPGKYKTVIRRSQTGSYSEGVNESCYMGFASSYCNTSWAGGLPDRHLWDQSGSAALSAALVDTDQGHERKMFDLEVSIESGKNPDVSPSTQFPDEPSMASNALDGDIFPYRVRSIPAGIDCPTLCKATFPQDTNITLYWTSLDKRYKIKSWYGDVCKNKIGLVKSNKLLSELSISPSEYKQVALCKFTLDEDVSVDLNLRKPSSRE